MSSLRVPPVALLGIALIAGACSPSDAAGNSAAAPLARPKLKGTAMASKPCKNGNLYRSKCMIELILDDVEQIYGAIDGGGISQIKAASSTSFSVSLPQEERVETLTYEFDVKDGAVLIKSKTSSTKSYGR